MGIWSSLSADFVYENRMIVFRASFPQTLTHLAFELAVAAISATELY